MTNDFDHQTLNPELQTNEVYFHFTDAFWITIHTNKNDTDNDTNRGQKIISLIKNDAKIANDFMIPTSENKNYCGNNIKID